MLNVNTIPIDSYTVHYSTSVWQTTCPCPKIKNVLDIHDIQSIIILIYKWLYMQVNLHYTLARSSYIIQSQYTGSDNTILIW